MGQELGLDVIAEGIESDEQANRLRLLGCEQGQGFLFSKAVDAASAEMFLLNVGRGIDRRVSFAVDSRSKSLP
jgi:EAL domain-containing protein (putative c-di-GMP-specific phosphodiesterase class I)